MTQQKGNEYVEFKDRLEEFKKTFEPGLMQRPKESPRSIVQASLNRLAADVLRGVDGLEGRRLSPEHAATYVTGFRSDRSCQRDDRRAASYHYESITNKSNTSRAQ